MKPSSRVRQHGGVLFRVLGWLIGLPLAMAVGGALIAGIVVILANDRLPSLEPVLDYTPRMPLRIYTVDGVQIGEFGEERRSFVPYTRIPARVRNAILAAEDARFFEHGGVDFLGALRAALANFRAGGTAQGASTITMQLAREFFLSQERTYPRKVAEILLSMRIEQALSKEEIFERYVNQIFLGKHAYGFEAAALTYFGKSLADVSVGEAAMLAGLPKAPSRFNPLVNETRALQRQHYVLRRMLENQFIDEQTYEQALHEKLVYAEPKPSYSRLAPYVAELARQMAVEMFGSAAYSAGLNVYTTVHSHDQAVANAALRDGILAYERRNAYRGPEDRLTLSTDPATVAQQIRDAVDKAGDIEGLEAAVVIEVGSKQVKLWKGTGDVIVVRDKGLDMVQDAIGKKANPDVRLLPGALVRVIARDDGYHLTQVPEVQAGFVALNTHDGSIRAMVGGFDFEKNKFNRVTQALRQPGSSFKPFVFSAALQRGFMTSTVVNDAPISLIDEDPVAGPQLWEPKNFDGRFEGPMTLRTAIARSKNLVSVRVMQRIGGQYARDYVTRFGFDRDRQPPVLTLGLGAGLVSPLQMASGISVFANGGFRIDPFLVSHITDAHGTLLAAAQPRLSGDEGNRIVDAENAYIMDSMLRDVVRRGTGSHARALGRPDIAGKTGTTNDSFDAWFVGYQPTIAATAWVGFDQPRQLGVRETGGGLALPIWLDYMKGVLPNVPVARLRPPPGVVRIDGELYLSAVTPEVGIRSVGMDEGGLSTGVERRRDVDKVRNELF
ncbi:MAG: PBP1A family penicillin-binding protein [Burkholderiaceae bacterium]